MSDFPKDGSTFVLESIDRIAYRWAKYKPDGARQMGKPGRWQKQVWSGDYFKWENCEEPTGEISSPIEDGPISTAFKSAAAKDAEIERLREALKPFADIADFFDSETEGFSMEDTLQLVIENEGFPNYHVNSFCLQRFYTARAVLKATEGSDV